MPKRYHPRRPAAWWDVEKLLDRLGPPGYIATLCRQAGFPAPRASTIRMWRARRRMPADWIATLLLLVDAKEIPSFIRAPALDPFDQQEKTDDAEGTRSK